MPLRAAHDVDAASRRATQRVGRMQEALVEEGDGAAVRDGQGCAVWVLEDREGGVSPRHVPLRHSCVRIPVIVERTQAQVLALVGVVIYVWCKARRATVAMRETSHDGPVLGCSDRWERVVAREHTVHGGTGISSGRYVDRATAAVHISWHAIRRGGDRDLHNRTAAKVSTTANLHRGVQDVTRNCWIAHRVVGFGNTRANGRVRVPSRRRRGNDLL